MTQGGVVGTVNQAHEVSYFGFDKYFIYGSSTDVWGESLNYKSINDPDFGFAIAAERNSLGGTTGGQIDDIRVTVSYSFIVLPVHLLSFSAGKTTDAVNLKWSTADEINMDAYQVQRSLNGSNFTTIGTVASRNSTSVSDYTFLDKSPEKGMSYYRLQLKSVSGKIEYSDIVAVNFKPGANISIYPNPLLKGQSLHVENPAREELDFKFYNVAGVFVTTARTNSSILPLNISDHGKEKLFFRVYDKNGNIKGAGTLMLE
jgi:hypothetical protein